MFPSLRGGNEGRGQQEGCYGEVDDVIAANYLAKQPHVDPKRIYLGGHSTGGSMALLVAECTDRFRAVIAFGPVTNVARYPRNAIELPFNILAPREVELRAPGLWLRSVKTPTYVFEGEQGNAMDLRTMRKDAPPLVRCTLIKGVDHFSILAPTNKILAQKILKDTGAKASLELTEAELKTISPAGAEPANAAERAAAPRGARPAAPARRASGRLEQTALAGVKGTKTTQLVISRNDRMTGFAFDLTDAGAIRTVDPVSVQQTKPKEQANRKFVTARDGYTLYGVVVDATDKVNAMRLVFARLDGEQIVATDKYESDWIGTPTANARPITLGCNGKKIAGLDRSWRDDQLTGFGLNLTDPPLPSAPAPGHAPAPAATPARGGDGLD
jgi:hypothetical protein